MINLAILLEESAREVPERTAIIFDGTRLSYAAVNAAANQVANVLTQVGIHKGETVALSCPNVPYFPIVYYGILMAIFNRLDRERKPGSIGLPVWGISVHVVDQQDQDVGTNDLGEIIIRGHNVMKGYYKRPEATAEAFRNGWFHTGDIGRQDEEGYLSIADRVKDMIIRGGFNVYPREIEEVLMTHPVVSLAAVVGVPDARHGEEVKAFVILKEGAEVTEAEVIAWAKQNMADYKYPRLIEFRTTLPLTATGKVLKSELRQEKKGQ